MVTRGPKGMLCSRPWPLAVAVLLSLVVATCGGPDETAGPAGASSSAPEAAGSTAQPAGSQSSSQPSSGKAGSLPMDALDADAIMAAQEEVMARIYETVLPSVVHIRVTQRVDQGTGSLPDIPGFQFPDIPDDFLQRGEGSGFVWDDQGHIVTNNHVVQDAQSVTVVFPDGAEVEARVLGTDPDSDLAVLELQGSKEGATPVTLGDSGAVRVGQTAVAIGNPFGQEFTMTTGIVSAVGRTIRSGNSQFSIPKVIQTDAPINPGNSGGPLLDRLGRVIGVNTQIISRSGVSAGVGFAVPINTAKQVIPALIAEGRYEHSWLGITGLTLPPAVAERMNLPKDTGGAQVIQVADDSPAKLAGLKGSDTTFAVQGAQYSLGGDVIVGIEGQPVRDMDDLIGFLTSSTRPGDIVTLEVIREGGEHQQVEVTLGKRPASGQ